MDYVWNVRNQVYKTDHNIMNNAGMPNILYALARGILLWVVWPAEVRKNWPETNIR
jgi:hypothetical protein